MQQTKHTRRVCAGGEASRHGAVARRAGAAGRPGTGEPRPSDAVSAGAATSAAVLSQDSPGKAAGSGRKAGVPTGGCWRDPWPAAWWLCHHPGRSALAGSEW